MGFSKKEVSKLLARCHRRCCICHKFCGVKMETHHIIPKDDNIDNAIPTCFECHAEIKLYNDEHPLGRKFQPEELREHKKQWLEICDKNPAIFVTPLERSDVGPLHAMIDEMEFNIEVAEYPSSTEVGCGFRDIEFNRIVSEGLLSLLTKKLKASLVRTYRKLGELNAIISAVINTEGQTHLLKGRYDRLAREMPSAKAFLEETRELLIRFLTEKED